MVTDLQIRRLLQLDAMGLPKSLAALKAGLDEKGLPEAADRH